VKEVGGIQAVDYLSIKIRPIWIALKAEPVYFWLFCGYLFFEYVRPQSAYPQLDILPWAKLLILGALATRTIAGEKMSLDNPLTFTSIAFFLAAMLSSVFAEYPSLSFERFASFVNWLVLYMLFLWIVTTRFRLFIVVLLLMLVSFKMSQHGAKTWVMRGMTFEPYGITGGAGYFGNAADLGVQMLIFAPLAAAFILGCRSYWGRYKRLFFYLFPLTAVMTVMATGERGTMLGLTSIGLVLVMAGKQRFRKLLIISLAGIAIFHLMPDEFKQRFETAGTDSTSQARLRYWARGLDMYRDHPVFGIGFNNWQRYYSSHYPGESLRAGHQEVAHSTPVTVAAEMGSLGFVFFYGMALWTIVTNLRTMKALRGASDEDKLWRFIAFGLNLGLVGFLVASCFVTQHEYPFLFVQASLSAALYNVVGRRSSSDPPARRFGHRRRRATTVT